MSPLSLDTGQQTTVMATDVAREEQTDADAAHAIKPDELELMYDPQLNCFYDPLTCKYYELAESD